MMSKLGINTVVLCEKIFRNSFKPRSIRENLKNSLFHQTIKHALDIRKFKSKHIHLQIAIGSSVIAGTVIYLIVQKRKKAREAAYKNSQGWGKYWSYFGSNLFIWDKYVQKPTEKKFIDWQKYWLYVQGKKECPNKSVNWEKYWSYFQGTEESVKNFIDRGKYWSYVQPYTWYIFVVPVKKIWNCFQQYSPATASYINLGVIQNYLFYLQTTTRIADVIKRYYETGNSQVLIPGLEELSLTIVKAYFSGGTFMCVALLHRFGKKTYYIIKSEDMGTTSKQFQRIIDGLATIDHVVNIITSPEDTLVRQIFESAFEEKTDFWCY